jgi:hypothetical protein
MSEALRKMLAAMPPVTWEVQRNAYGTGIMFRLQPDDFTNVCWWSHEDIYDHTEPCRDLIIAAVNAAPGLLKKVEDLRARNAELVAVLREAVASLDPEATGFALMSKIQGVLAKNGEGT